MMTRLMKLLQEEAGVAVFVVVVAATAAVAAAVVVEVVAAAAAVVAVFSFFSFLNLMYHSHCQFWGLWVVPTQWVYYLWLYFCLQMERQSLEGHLEEVVANHLFFYLVHVD